MTLRLRPMTTASTTRAAILALVLLQGLPAFAQEGVPGTAPNQLPKGNQAPLDINKPAAKEESKPKIADGPAYNVSRFEMSYRTEHPEQPPLDLIGETKVRLGVSPTGYVQYQDGMPSVTIRVADVVEGTSTTFHRSAIISVLQAVVADFDSRGIWGVKVWVDSQDIDASGTDLRAPDRSTLHLVISTMKAARVNSLALGPRLGVDSAEGDQVEARYDHPNAVHRRIRAQSPVQVGDLMKKNALDDFAHRLNRHPGRNVVAQQGPLEGPDNPEAGELTYRIYEAKPWTAYFELSNTGTEQTNEWRERFGFVHNQLTSHDDILRVDYVTGGFEGTNALVGSYQFPILSDRINARLFGSYSEFDASQVGFADEEFTGATGQAGAEVRGLVYQHRDWFVDTVGGVRWQRVSVTDSLVGTEGDANFLIPYLGARVERNSLARSTSGGVSVETNLTSVDQDELDQLGRFNTDDNWVVLKYDLYHSTLLGPSWGLGDSLAHELVGKVRGQYAFDYRLIANEQDVVGGAYTVRGYPESASAGDSTIVASLEYKYHVPRGFSIAEPGTMFGRPARTAKYRYFGQDFRYHPSEPMGFTDWDLALSAFFDIGRTVKNEKLPGETDNSLSSVGVGAEFSLRSNVSLRLDWGFALQDLQDGSNTVDAGDSRLHVNFMLMY